MWFTSHNYWQWVLPCDKATVSPRYSTAHWHAELLTCHFERWLYIYSLAVSYISSKITMDWPIRQIQHATYSCTCTIHKYNTLYTKSWTSYKPDINPVNRTIIRLRTKQIKTSFGTTRYQMEELKVNESWFIWYHGYISLCIILLIKTQTYGAKFSLKNYSNTGIV